MSIINANIAPMRVCWIFGVPALFTPYRVSRQTVHFGLYQYDMQALLDSPNEVFVLAEQAEDLFYGTILPTQKIELPRGSRSVNFISRTHSPIWLRSSRRTPAPIPQILTLTQKGSGTAHRKPIWSAVLFSGCAGCSEHGVCWSVRSFSTIRTQTASGHIMQIVRTGFWHTAL